MPLVDSPPLPAPPLAQPASRDWRRVLAGPLRRIADAAAPLCRSWRWAASAAACGCVPFAASWISGRSGHQWISAVLLAWLCLACARHEAWWKGLAVIACAFCAHSAAVIGIAFAFPDSAERLLPGAHAYWEKQLVWIETGRDPEYDPRNWVGAHGQLLAASTVFSCASLGTVTFAQGFHEVDLMNYYTARLAARSRNRPLALALGWHLWSVLRGVGYLVLTWELIRLSMGWLTASNVSLRPWGWALGLGCLVADGLTKFYLLEAVRAGLHSNLL